MEQFKEATLEEVEELYDMLTGNRLPEGMEIPDGERPDLGPKQAFAVIWFLQERMGLLPDHYEQCETCLALFDTWETGTHIDDDEPNDWQARLGVTRELLKEHAGYHLCCDTCELAFWRDRMDE